MLALLSPGWIANMYLKNEANKPRLALLASGKDRTMTMANLHSCMCGNEQKIKDELILCHSTAIDSWTCSFTDAVSSHLTWKGFTMFTAQALLHQSSVCLVGVADRHTLVLIFGFKSKRDENMTINLKLVFSSWVLTSVKQLRSL